jgi:hypothetical protein
MPVGRAALLPRRADQLAEGFQNTRHRGSGCACHNNSRARHLFGRRSGQAQDREFMGGHPDHTARHHPRSCSAEHRAVRSGVALEVGPRYAFWEGPMTRLTTMAAMPARTALAMGDESMSLIGFEADPCS